MRIVLFYHSLISDWNHGNAHFLRGVVTELLARGNQVDVYEPKDAWSVQNLLLERGPTVLSDYQRAYPGLSSIRYDKNTLNLHTALVNADLVLVHEWNDHELVCQVGNYRREHGEFTLLFHDTHHRSITEHSAMENYDLSGYDGVLAFGRVIRDLYLEKGWAKNVWTWHEAADTRVFYPRTGENKAGDLVWIGNWGDGERTGELYEFLIEPIRTLGLSATVYGVRYPENAVRALRCAGIQYGGWLPNYEAPIVYAQHRVTIHVPRRPYVEKLPGIPTIRPFEALACGIPLVSAPWSDNEHLFSPGKDFLVANNGGEMAEMLVRVLSDSAVSGSLIENGLNVISSRHTCAHRVDELLTIYDSLKGNENLLCLAN